MSDWKEIELGEVADVQTGPFGSQLKNEQYIKGGTPVVTVKHIQNFRISDFDYPSITDKDKERLSKYLMKEGDIIFTRVGSVDLSAYVKKHQHGWMFSSRMLRVRPKEEINSRFLSYFFQQKIFRDYIVNISVGATMPSINTEILRTIPISYPPLLEQKAIAEVLSSLDDKINLLHHQNQTLEQLAETQFRQWFDNYLDQEYKIYLLKDIVKQIKPGTNYQPKRIESGIPFLNVRNLSDGFVDASKFKFISEEEYHRVHKSWKPEKNDIVISRIGTLGLVSILREIDLPIAVHYNMLCIKESWLDYSFIYFLLKSDFFQTEYDMIKRVSVQEYVAVDDCKIIQIPLPVGQNLDKYISIYRSYLSKINSNSIQIRTLKNLRDTLLPKLMSGEVRVKMEAGA